ncbi:ABC transporter substrate-binding protein [Herbaspirillum sp. NPDC087042]|uniref:ABC transporter substrate-binding protein n=1 Tax=Herbaspirillum sp. NPDC087042 TaxID=3364004 RepID=UPI00382A4B7E
MKFTRILACCMLFASMLSGAVSAADTTLTWRMWSNNEAETKVWQHLADMVTEAHPDIRLKLEFAPWNDYWTKLPVLAASGHAGDIIGMQSLRMPNFYKILAPLDGNVAADKMDLSAFDSSIIGSMKADGKLYGMPYDVGAWVIFYNHDLFAKKGVADPKPGWTYDDMIKTAKALTGNGTYGIGIAPQNFSVLAAAMGASYVTGGKLDLANAGSVDAARKMIDLAAKEKVAPLVAAAGVPVQMISGRFDGGNLGMYIDGPWALLSKKGKVDFKLGVATLPAGPNGLSAATAGSGFGVARSSKHPDAAWKAIKVLTSEKALNYLASNGRAFPARKSEQNAWYALAKDVVNGREALDYSMAHSRTYEITANFNTVENLFDQYFPLAFAGSATPEKTMATIQSLANK